MATCYIVSMGLWYYETFGDRVRFGLKTRRTLFSKRSEHQLVEVFETVEFGNTLAVDHIYMTSEKDEHYYHEMLVHPALTSVLEPTKVLIIGGGDGGTAREVLRHKRVRQVVMVEIDQVVVDASRQHLPNHFSWDDPRFNLVIGDGIQYVADAPDESFDVVLLDGSDPVGPAEGLFNRSFYENVKRVVKPTGVFGLQSEGPIIQRETFLAIQRELSPLFRIVKPYFGPVPIYGAGIWSWTIASDSIDPLSPDLERAAKVERKTKYYNRDIHRAAFALPNDLRRALASA